MNTEYKFLHADTDIYLKSSYFSFIVMCRYKFSLSTGVSVAVRATVTRCHPCYCLTDSPFGIGATVFFDRQDDAARPRHRDAIRGMFRLRRSDCTGFPFHTILLFCDLVSLSRMAIYKVCTPPDDVRFDFVSHVQGGVHLAQ